jgi:iron-sulfur cluster repair protein YtfE (RIC family)
MQDNIILPDESTRPKAPKIPGVSETQRRQGRRLALFHEMHLRELAKVRRAMAGVFAGEGTADQLLVTISSMQMFGNMRQFGNLCGAACEMLTGHHMIEDQYVFPAMHGKTAGLNMVVERLRAEHLVIHALLVRLEAAAAALITGPGAKTAKDLRAEFGRLEGFVASHFGYEQSELEEALGVYGVDI